MKNYLVIGASTGIGRALALQLAEQGHQVFATYHHTPTQGNGDHLHYHPLNVLDEQLALDFLPEELHGVAYCPGSITLKPFHRLKPASFTADFELQVGGAIKVLQTVLPRLKASGEASVVLFSTVAVQMGFNFHSQVSASKGAIEGLTRALAAEWAPAIRVNAIAPSLTDTPLAGRLLNSEDKKAAHAERHPLKRVGEPEDLAQTAAFLLSDATRWMTGQVLQVDGGMSGIRG